MIRQVSTSFNDTRKADAEAGALAASLSDRYDGRMFHVVDVVKTQAEADSVTEEMQYAGWGGWTFVADADGIDELDRRYHRVEVFDTFGWEEQA